MSKKERMSSGAECAESARRQEVLEIFKQLRKEADRNAAPILDATEARLDELEAEDALRSGTLFSDPNDDLVN
jgi:vacuolar-type H+-ATPase subunit H